jgi:peptidoglycan/LPS O-acetylase OafA/YrhL
LLSWFAHFEEEHYRIFVSTNKFLIAGVSILFVSIPFFVELTYPLFYTAGLSILYLGFGGLVALVSVFKMPATNPVKILAGIGRFSYTIYLVHLITGPAVANFFRLHVFGNGPPLLYAFISFGANICCGIIISLLVEQFFLRIRERYFPKIY